MSTISGLREYIQEKSNTCFEVEEKTKKTILCAFNSGANKNLQEMAQEWQKDILDFIKNCSDSYFREVIKLNKLNKIIFSLIIKK